MFAPFISWGLNFKKCGYEYFIICITRFKKMLPGNNVLDFYPAFISFNLLKALILENPFISGCFFYYKKKQLTKFHTYRFNGSG